MIGWDNDNKWKKKEKRREKGRVRRKERSGDRAIRNEEINEESMCNVRVRK